MESIFYYGSLKFDFGLHGGLTIGTSRIAASLIYQSTRAGGNAVRGENFAFQATPVDPHDSLNYHGDKIFRESKISHSRFRSALHCYMPVRFWLQSFRLVGGKQALACQMAAIIRPLLSATARRQDCVNRVISFALLSKEAFLERTAERAMRQHGT